MIKKGNITIVIILLVLVVSLSAIYSNKLKQETITTSTNPNELDTTRICWGIKRADSHQQPDVGAKNKKILDENNGICLGNNEKNYIYLTFDSGYEAGYTEQILQALRENNVTATFFLTAHYINTQPDLVKQMIDDGNIIGNHTVNHKSMPDLTEEQINTELMDFHKVMCEKFQYEMKYMRPPKGEYSEKSINITNKLGYKTVMWSFAYEDWDEKKQPSEESAKKKILDNLHNGEIMLLHGTSKTNALIMGDVIRETKSMGYEFKSLSEFEQ